MINRCERFESFSYKLHVLLQCRGGAGAALCGDMYEILKVEPKRRGPAARIARGRRTGSIGAATLGPTPRARIYTARAGAVRRSGARRVQERSDDVTFAANDRVAAVEQRALERNHVAEIGPARRVHIDHAQISSRACLARMDDLARMAHLERTGVSI